MTSRDIDPFVLTAAGERIDILSAKLAYLATPYSRYPEGLHCAFIDASKLAAQLMQRGVKVYSPIAHTHPLALYGQINPLDHKIWLPFDQAMMDVCDILIVAEMRTWQISYGIAHEIDWFTRVGKPVVYLDPVRLVLRTTPGAVTAPLELPERPLS